VCFYKVLRRLVVVGEEERGCNLVVAGVIVS